MTFPAAIPRQFAWRICEVYLIDTNVISAAASSKRAASTELVAWMDAHSAALFLSAISIAEIQDGIAKSRREGAARKAAALTEWLETILHLYGDRVLPLDAEVALAAGELSEKARGLGRPSGLADVVIAATAVHHRLTLLTRNVKHFAPFGVSLHDPFLDLP